jgi:hypothetical protein
MNGAMRLRASPDERGEHMVESRVGDVVFDVNGAVGRVVIDQDSTRNALSPAVITGLDAAIDAGCAAVVVRGTGGTLSAGADLKFLRKVLDDESALRDYITSIGGTLDRLEAAPFVSICVVDGYTVAGGCEIMLACDLSVVSEQAKIGDRHLEYGLLPGAGGSVRLTQAVASAIGPPPALYRRDHRRAHGGAFRSGQPGGARRRVGRRRGAARGPAGPARSRRADRDETVAPQRGHGRAGTGDQRET